MAGNASRIRVAQNARLWLAPVGTLAPVDPLIAMGEGWYDVGLFTADSLGFSTDPTFEEVRSHQSNYPTRRFQTADAASFEVDLQEWSGQNFLYAFGGGTLTKTGTGANTVYKFTPPAIGGRSEVAACIEIFDGSLKYRRLVPRAFQQEGVSQTFNRTAESTLPLRMGVLGGDIGDPFYDLSNDPAFEPIAA